MSKLKKKSNGRQRVKLAASSLVLCLIGITAPPLYAAIPQLQYDKVIQSARDGDAKTAARQLQEWQRLDPQNIRIVQDLAVVSEWAGEYETALQFSERLLDMQTPPYVLHSLARSARAEKKWDVVERAYRVLLQKNARDNEAHAGLATSWLDQGREDAALQYVIGKLPAHSSQYAAADVPLIMVMGRIYRDRQQTIQAANAYRDAHRLDPQSREAYRAYVFTLNEAGMPYLAGRVADQRQALFTIEERRAIAHAEAGGTIGFGAAQLTTEHNQPRFGTTDVAIDRNTAVTQQYGERSITEFDRMVALRDRQRMQEVVDLHQSLNARNIDLPPYAKAAAADAYLYLQQPATARDLYASAIEEAGKGDVASLENWRMGLTYAYVETEQHRQAQETVDQLLLDTPQFANRGIPGIESPNDSYPIVATLTASVRMYAERLREAEAMIASLKEAAPFNPQVRTAWAELKMARGQPREALETYELLRVDQPDEMPPRLGRGNALLSLNEFTAAKEELPPLVEGYPENKAVQRYARLLDIYDRPVLEVESTFGRGGGQVGAQTLVEARLYSAPMTNSLGDPWRIYSRYSHANGDIDRGQPTAFGGSRDLLGVGVDYRIRDWTIEAEANQGLRNAERTGMALRLTHDFDDQWQARLEADSNVNDLAARAFVNDITARRMTAGVTWRQNESRSIDGEIANTHFSDGNRRDSATVGWTERLVSGPVLKLDTVLTLATSRNSLPNAVYFNPSSAHEATIGFNAQWRTWRHYQRSFTQRIQVYGGRYWQEGFDSGGTSGALYGHEWAIDDAFTLGYGIGISTHPYDGVREKRRYGYLNLIWAIK